MKIRYIFVTEIIINLINTFMENQNQKGANQPLTKAQRQAADDRIKKQAQQSRERLVQMRDRHEYLRLLVEIEEYEEVVYGKDEVTRQGNHDAVANALLKFGHSEDEILAYLIESRLCSKEESDAWVAKQAEIKPVVAEEITKE